MHIVETLELGPINKNDSNKRRHITSNGKLAASIALFALIICAIFVFDSLSTPSIASLPEDAMGKCQISYITDPAVPLAQSPQAEGVPATDGVAAGADKPKDVYLVEMPDGQRLEGYGVQGAYIPLDGEYSFSGVLRSDGGYNVTIASSYVPASKLEVHDSSRADFKDGRSATTQIVSDFTWYPTEEYAATLSGEGDGTADSEGGDTGTESGDNVDGSGDMETGDPADALSDTGDEGDAADGGLDLGSDPAAFDPVSAPDDISELISIKIPPVSNPVRVEGQALDFDTGNRSACIGEDGASIHVELTYENLQAERPFTMIVELIDSATGKHITDASGNDMIVAREQTAVPRGKNKDKGEGSSGAEEAIEQYLETLKAVTSGSAGSDPSLYDKLSGIIEEGTHKGASYISSRAKAFKKAYEASLESGLALPALQEVADACEELRAAEEHASLGDGTFSMDVFADKEQLLGKTVKVKVELSLDGEPVASLPIDADDERYIVRYPAIESEATIRGVHEAKAENGTVIIDTVRYKSLVPGTQYHLESAVIDAETGSEVVDSKTFDKVRRVTEFVPQESDGVINVIFPEFDSTSMNGRRATVSENIYECTDGEDGASKASTEQAQSSEGMEPSGKMHSMSKTGLVAEISDSGNPLASIDFVLDSSLAETGIQPAEGALSLFVGDEIRFFAIILGAVLAIGSLATVRACRRRR